MKPGDIIKTASSHEPGCVCLWGGHSDEELAPILVDYFEHPQIGLVICVLEPVLRLHALDVLVLTSNGKLGWISEIGLNAIVID